MRVQDYQNTNLHSHYNSFLTKKMVKNGYYGKECFGLARDCIETRHMNLFTTTCGSYFLIKL